MSALSLSNPVTAALAKVLLDDDPVTEAEEALADVRAEPSAAALVECVADKGCHSRAVLKDLDGGVRKSRIAEPRREAFLRWHSNAAARKTVYGDRARLRSGAARAAMCKHAEPAERPLAHTLDCGGSRRAWLRGRVRLARALIVRPAEQQARGRRRMEEA